MRGFLFGIRECEKSQHFLFHPLRDATEALLAYQKLTEEERGKFLREKGLHEADLQRWKAVALKGMKLEPFVGGKKHPQAKRIAALERELRRKEAALAETAALLVLKKKADLIWGEGKDER